MRRYDFEEGVTIDLEEFDFKENTGMRKYITCPFCLEAFRSSYYQDRLSRKACHPSGCRPAGQRASRIRFKDFKTLKIGDVTFYCCPYLGRWTVKELISQRYYRRNDKGFMGRHKNIINEDLENPLFSKEATIHAYETGLFKELLFAIMKCEKGVGWKGLANHIGFTQHDIEFTENITELMKTFKLEEQLDAIVYPPKEEIKQHQSHKVDEKITEREKARREKILDSLPDNCGWKGIMPNFSKKAKGWIIRNYVDLRRLVPDYVYAETIKMKIKTKCECPICFQPFQTGKQVQKHLIGVHQIKTVVDSDSSYRRE